MKKPERIVGKNTTKFLKRTDKLCQDLKIN